MGYRGNVPAMFSAGGWSMSAMTGQVGGAVFLNCPRCGLSLRRRVDWLTVEYCPRCIGRAEIPVKLFVCTRPADDWHQPLPPPENSR